MMMMTSNNNHICYLINGCKIKEYFEKTRHVKNNDKSKKYIFRGQRNVRYHERVLSNKKICYNFNFISNST